MNFGSLTVVALLVLSCSTAKGVRAFSAIDATGSALADVLGWCDESGADTASARELLERGDRAGALLVARNLVQHLRQNGLPVPREVETLLRLLVELEKKDALP